MCRVLYLVSGMTIYSSVQEEGDCASMAPAGSEMKSAPSLLQQGHTERCRLATQGHTDRQGTLTLPEHYTREEQAHMYVCMYVHTCEDSAINYVEIDVGILVL